MKVAIDTMGGDSAPAIPVEGVKIALRECPSIFPVLVGDGNRVETEMKRVALSPDCVEIIHASQVVTMADPPTSALREKKDSSITVALTLHRMGNVKAVVGAGNTGAQIAASMVKLGRVEGVLRPVIGSLIPTSGKPCLLLDIGANTDCRAIHLLQFGIMGAIFVKEILEIDNPRVGLLSIGAEKTRGNEVSLFAYHLFRESHLNFIGNIEGSDLLRGKVDVAVCDGFVGNLLLKFAESFPNFLISRMENMDNGRECNVIKGFFKRTFNPEFYGGVPILGVKGVSMVCHGASSPRAIANALKSAADMAERGINSLIAEQLSDIHRFYEMNRYFKTLRKRWESKRERMFWSPGRFFSWFSDKDSSKED